MAPDHLFRAYAKINIGLSVTERRPDGYHNICTVFHRVDLFDDIAIRPAVDITVYSTDPSVPAGELNSCHRAARLLQEHLGVRNGAEVVITKRIPVGGGLGGGSADGAVVLRELPRLWGEHLGEVDLRTIALQLGSDVPYFLGTDSALGTGRGEVLEYFSLDIPFVILLCTPAIHVSTTWAYQQITPRGATRGDIRSILQKGNTELIRIHCVNDFELPVFEAYPEIREIKESMVRSGAVFSSMSGTGSSVYGFFPDPGSAHHLAAQLESGGTRTFITPPHFRL